MSEELNSAIDELIAACQAVLPVGRPPEGPKGLRMVAAIAKVEAVRRQER